MLSEKKAKNALKPWWDIAFQYSIIALLSLALLMLVVTSGFGQDQYLSITNAAASSGANMGIKTTRIRKNGQIDLIVSSKIVSDESTQSNLTKVHEEVIDESDTRNVEEMEEEPKTFRAKRSIRNVNNVNNNGTINGNDEKSRTQDVIHAIYSLVILTIIYLIETAFDRLFYADHLLQSLVHLISVLSDVREFDKTNHGLIFANTLHHSVNRSFLWTLFWLKNFSR